MISSAASVISVVDSVLRCSLNCLSSGNCRAFNFQKRPSPPNCIIFDSQFRELSNGQLVSDSNYDYYELNDCYVYNPCLNGGTCVKPINSTAGVACICSSNYTGTLCDTAVTTTTTATNTSTTVVSSIADGSAKTCNGTTTMLTNIDGMFNSDDYPTDYVNNLNCSWLINVTSALTITFVIDYMSIENSTRCTFDNLTFYDGPSNKNTKLYSLCGIYRDVGFTTSTNQALVLFHSDYSVTRAGFNITYFGNS
ncbi:hypothetical protein CHUAL_003372 [Chamberlinius hualienensis]